jgi:crossover junction endodeoxyribonuclease RuvC
MSVKALGFDPGFASLGWAAVEVLPESVRVIDMGVIETEPSPKKRRQLQADDNVRRAREIDASLVKLFAEHRPGVVCAESMSFPRNSAAAAKMAMAWGVIVSRTGSLPLLQASPQEIKMSVCGAKSASKDDVESVLRARFNRPAFSEPETTYPSTLEVRTISKMNPLISDHAWDALGAVVACLGSDLIRGLRRNAS